MVHLGVPVSKRNEDGRPQLSDVQILRRSNWNCRKLYIPIPSDVRNYRKYLKFDNNVYSHGHFYTIPTKSEIVADGQDGLWLTQFKGGNLTII